jgi:prephenate dehydrogenase
MDIKKIVVMGAGQVGTSLVMAVRKQYPDVSIVVMDTQKNVVVDTKHHVVLDPHKDLHKEFAEALEKANFGMKNIDLVFDNPQKVADADIIILAAPISEFGKVVEKLAPYISAKSIITDIGSVKGLSIERINTAIDKTCPQLSGKYVPSHIMNGNAGSGPLTASPQLPQDKTLLDGKPMIIVPGVATEAAYQYIKNFWQSLNANIFEMSATQHDNIVGTTSHFHYASMFALILTDKMRTGEGTDLGAWVHGARGMTRVADAGTKMWQAVFKDNRENIIHSAEQFKKILLETAQIVQIGEEKAVATVIQSAHAYAKEVRGDRGGSPVPEADYLGKNDLINSAFGALVSIAVTLNVKRAENETGQPFAPMANPSAKDGMGPIGIDPKAVAYLLKTYGPQLSERVDEYVAKLDTLTSAIARNDNTAICGIIDEARATRQTILKGPDEPQARNSSKMASTLKAGPSR